MGTAERAVLWEDPSSEGMVEGRGDASSVIGFDADVWDLSAPPWRDWVTIGGCSAKWRFSAFGESPAKAEIKRALIREMDVKTDLTAVKYGDMIRLIGRFASEKLPKSSLLDVTEREACALFGEFIEGIGVSSIKVRKDGTREPSEAVRIFRKLYVSNAMSSADCDLLRLDTWLTDRLPLFVAPHRHPPSSKPGAILFRNIRHESIAIDCKLFALHSLKTLCTSTVATMLQSLSAFFSFVAESFPEVTRTSQLDRSVVVAFIGWVNEGGCSARTGNVTLSTLRSFLETTRLMGGDAPLREVVYEEDGFKVGKRTPEYFSRGEQRRLLEHLRDLEQPFRWMLTVHYQVGMRVSELCSLEEGCLRRAVSGAWYLEYYQYKTRKFNSVPVTDEVVQSIVEAIRDSKAAHGEGCRYVFADVDGGAMDIVKYRNRLSKYVRDHRILGDDGSLLNVRTHKFRATVATNMINNPAIDDVSLIRMFLGQARLGVLERYAVIHGSTMIRCLSPITQRDEAYINNMGKLSVDKPVDLESTSPLCNGLCARPPESGPCSNFNACYSCAMFKPSRDSLGMFEFQLEEVEKRIQVARANGYQRTLEINENLRDQLESIVAKLKRAGS